MKIVGVGCGPGMLTEAAIQAIQSSHLIAGSERALELVRGIIPAGAELKPITDFKTLKTLPDHAVILSTGDPMISGLGYLGGEIIPGISSVQLGAAKTKISLTNLFLITAHGRNHDQAVHECCEMIRARRKVCIIADPAFPIHTLGDSLSSIHPDIQIYICENLGYPDERIAKGTAQKPPKVLGIMFILFIVPEE
ncbi:cobalt-precorrin-7 (C(5))-methyltransferase [Methanospirillum sp.]|uniref:cobalt-precorrin-7 (C(5))-methyltransferase n=1 Tax=Methanospirillum sp. TaxID=45200 RepID=UPI002BD6AC98|nr:cobalt-precorrin-7 (C(5))-methyltransferase [Methanospirillum sp.]HPP77974.1 cobalt-precorrin-7 (C(5))-methyltransferase [Methanospirillum sp.]